MEYTYSKIISVLRLFVNYDSDEGWTNILSRLLKSKELSKDFDEIINQLTGRHYEIFTNKDILEFIDGTDEAKKSLSLFLDTWDGTGNLADEFQNYINNSANSLTKFSSTLKSVAANMGIMLAVSLAIKGIITLWDKLNVTVEETQQKYDELSSSISTLQSEYDTLNSRDYDSLSDSEKERLKYLEDRIELEKELLEIQQQEIYDEKVGGKFTDYFDKDSYTYKIAFSTNEYENTGFIEGTTRSKADSIDRIIKEYNKSAERLQEL